MVSAETKYFVDLKDYFYEAVVGSVTPRLENSNFSHSGYDIRNAKKFGYERSKLSLLAEEEEIFEVDLNIDLHDVKLFTNSIPGSGSSSIGGKNIIMNKSAGRNEEMQTLSNIILKIVLFLVVPHYILVCLVNYNYRPRLANMIYNFKEELMERNSIINSYSMSKIFS
jgi:hypothetical protein